MIDVLFVISDKKTGVPGRDGNLSNLVYKSRYKRATIPADMLFRNTTTNTNYSFDCIVIDIYFPGMVLWHQRMLDGNFQHQEKYFQSAMKYDAFMRIWCGANATNME
jgi:hypothetical protein